MEKQQLPQCKQGQSKQSGFTGSQFILLEERKRTPLKLQVALYTKSRKAPSEQVQLFQKVYLQGAFGKAPSPPMQTRPKVNKVVSLALSLFC